VTGLRLQSERLLLVAATLESARAEIAGRAELAAFLECETPDDWPPPLNDADSMHWFLDFINENPDAAGWGFWYFTTLANGRRVLVGNGGFKGRPTEDSTVEIGYSVLPRFHRRGYASEAVETLVAWAFAQNGVGRVIAHTFPELEPSIGVLRKCGFAFVGKGEEERTIMFERWPGGGGAPGVTNEPAS
jgi:[ribosomal protein S5]-alanine N-acetyltransferase